MPKRRILLATALALPAIAVIVWMLTPAPQPSAETSPLADAPQPATRAAAPVAAPQSSRTMVTASTTRSGAPGIARRSDEDFPELIPAPTAAPVLPDQTASAISPRYTLATQPNAATLARRLEGQPALARDERLRVLPAEAAATVSTETVPVATAAPEGGKKQRAAADGVVLLKLDATLHDPAVWLEDGKPLPAAHAEVKAKIADEFDAEISAAAKQPKATGKTFDETWRDARARANAEYQMFFGGDAANRAGLNAGRAALSKQ